MTVCPSCGFRNEESESFCRNPACTAFLGWAEERVNAERRATASDAATGDPPSPGASVQEDTQPFDVAAEARRSDRAAGTPRQTRAGSPGAPPQPPGTGASPPTGSPRPSESPPPGVTSALRGSPASGEPPTSGATGGTSARPGATADPFATGPFAPGRARQPEWQAREPELQAREPQRPEEPAPRYEPPGEWGRGVYSQGRDPTTDESGRRVLSAAETAWGTRDFVQRPQPREQGKAPPPAAGTTSAPPEEPSYESAWPTADPTRATRAGRTARPAAEPAPRSSFPSESALLKQPPLWERLLRQTPLPVPGEGSLRRAPSARERERRRALLRFAVLVLVIILVGSGLWIASTRKPAETAGGTGGGNNAGPAAPALVSVRPGRVQASTQSGSRVATNVIDGKPDTYWSRSAPSDDDQPFLRFFFNGKVKLARISIASGAAGSEYSRRPRPRQIELRFSDDSTVRATLADRASFQTVSFPPREVDVLRVVVLSTYPSAGPQRTSINEVRFLAVKS